MIEARMVWAWMLCRLDKMKEDDNDRGELVPWVAITAALVAAALIITAILVAKATDAANNVVLQ